MLVRLKLRGKGTDQEPWHGNIPTGNEILTLVSQGVTYWIIPDDTHPQLMEHPSAKTEETGHGAALIGLDAEGHAQWHEHLDTQYKEAAGKFRPEVI